MDVLHFLAVGWWQVKRRLTDFFVTDRNAKTSSELKQFLFVHLLLVVGNVAALAGFAQPVTLDGFCKHDGWTTVFLGRRFVCRVDFFGVMTAATHLLQFFVAVVFNQLQKLGILAKEVFANVATGHSNVLLVLSVNDFVHAFGQQPSGVFGQQSIPVIAPDNFDHVPARTTENRLQFLDDFSISANGTIKTLQVAVDDED